MELLIGILGGIISSTIIAIISWFYAKKYKKQIIVFLGKVSGTGIEYIYKNDDEANVDMIKAVNRSQIIKVFSMRAFRMLKDQAGLKILLSENCPADEVRVLLADHTSLAVSKRADEFVYIDATYTKDRYIEDIYWSIKQVKKNQKNKKLNLKIHSEPAFIRMLITDDYMFLSFFLRDSHGDNSKVFKINRFSPLYEA